MIIKTFVDIEKIRSMFKLALERYEIIQKLPREFPTIIVETYYEVIKEFLSLILLSQGFRSVGDNAHKDLIDYFYDSKFLEDSKFFLLNDLRIKRNDSFYYGKPIDNIYLKNKEKQINEVVLELKKYIEEKIKVKE
jgi:hypothetical protein